MFCPNCGAQNNDTANVCGKCGFTLKSTGAPKFKGTMLMMNAPPAAVPRPTAGTPAAAPPAAPPQAAPTPPPAGMGGPPPAGAQPGFAPKPKLKGTMIGVAPPSMGSAVPTPGAQQGMGSGMPPLAGGAAGPPQGGPSPVPTAQMGSPDAGYPGARYGMGGPPQQQQQPPPAGPPEHVNPLGGTVVADAGFMPGGFPPGAGAPPMNPQQGFGQPPPGFGAPPQPSFGAPPHDPSMGGMPPSPMGAPQQMGGGYGAQMPPQQPGALAGPGQFGGGTMQSAGSTTDMDLIPGKVGGPNPIVTVLLIVLTCGIYGIYLLIKNRNKPAAM